MPNTPPAEAGTAPILQAMGMLGEFNFLIFIVVSMIFFGLMQFYFLGTAQFMQDMGIPARNVPASMAVLERNGLWLLELHFGCCYISFTLLENHDG